jgi:hypothetical protein
MIRCNGLVGCTEGCAFLVSTRCGSGQIAGRESPGEFSTGSPESTPGPEYAESAINLEWLSLTD